MDGVAKRKEGSLFANGVRKKEEEEEEKGFRQPSRRGRRREGFDIVDYVNCAKFILETVLQFAGHESETVSRNRRIPPLSGGDDTSAAFARWGKGFMGENGLRTRRFGLLAAPLGGEGRQTPPWPARCKQLPRKPFSCDWRRGKLTCQRGETKWGDLRSCTTDCRLSEWGVLAKLRERKREHENESILFSNEACVYSCPFR